MEVRARSGRQRREHRIVAATGQRFVRPMTDPFDRPADDDPRQRLVERVATFRDHMVEEARAQFLEAEAALEHRGMFEAGRGGDRLERLEEAASLRKVEIFGDRPWPRRRFQTTPDRFLLPEAQGGAEHRGDAIRTGDRHQHGLAITRDGGDRIGGAEVEAEHGGGGRGGHRSLVLQRRWSAQAGKAAHAPHSGPSGSGWKPLSSISAGAAGCRSSAGAIGGNRCGTSPPKRRRI